MSLSLPSPPAVQLEEWIRFLNQPNLELRLVALNEINRQNLVLPASELARLLHEKDLRMLGALLYYAQNNPINPDDQLQLYWQILASEEPSLIRKLAAIMPEIKPPLPEIKAILTKICADNEELSSALIDLIKNQIDIIPHNFLIALCEHPKTKIALAAIMAVNYSPQSSYQPTFKKLLSHPHPKIRALAVLGLWKLGVAIIYKLLKEEKNPTYLAFYLNVLGKTTAEPAHIKLLLSFLAQEKPLLKRAAAMALIKLADIPAQEELLLAAFSNKTDDISRAIIFQCLEEKDPHFAFFHTTNLYELAQTQGQQTWMENMGRLIFLSGNSAKYLDEICAKESELRPQAQFVKSLLQVEQLRKHQSKLRRLLTRPIKLPTNKADPTLTTSLQSSACSLLQLLGTCCITRF